MPGPTKPPCIGSCPEPPPETSPAFYLDIWRLRLTSRHQHVVDEEVVHNRAYQPPDNWSDDWEPPVPVDVAVVPLQRHSVPAGEPGEKPWAEVAGRIDRVTRIRAEGHPDPRHEQADDERPQVSFRGQVPFVDDREHDSDQ